MIGTSFAEDSFAFCAAALFSFIVSICGTFSSSSQFSRIFCFASNFLSLLEFLGESLDLLQRVLEFRSVFLI